MFIVHQYPVAVFLCVVTMLCWGSWGNTQKLASRSWRYEYFYWDYVVGILVCSLLFALTLGSFGDGGRSFVTDLGQADPGNIGLAITGGVIFNAANILLSAAIALCGMSVAFPVGIGLALVLGVLINYFAAAKGAPFYIFSGVALIALAIGLNALAYRKSGLGSNRTSIRGIVLSIAAGGIMAFFYRFVAASMDLDNFNRPAAGKLTSYTAVVVFAIGILVSNFPFNYLARRKAMDGRKLPMSGYFKGSLPTHLVGIAGGCIWCVGQSLSLIASGKAGVAISYGLGQGATLVSALWGIFVWKEFAGAPRISHRLNAAMFVLFLAGLCLLIYAGA